MVQFNSKAIHLSKSTLIIYSVVTKGGKVEQKSLQSVKTVPQDYPDTLFDRCTHESVYKVTRGFNFNLAKT